MKYRPDPVSRSNVVPYLIRTRISSYKQRAARHTRLGTFDPEVLFSF